MHSYNCCSGNGAKIKDIKKLSGLFRIVSDNSRLQILCILKKGEHCVCQLEEHLNMSQSLISHHLKDLKNADIISGRKDGRWSYYSLTTKGLQITNLIFKIKI